MKITEQDAKDILYAIEWARNEGQWESEATDLEQRIEAAFPRLFVTPAVLSPAERRAEAFAKAGISARVKS